MVSRVCWTDFKEWINFACNTYPIHPKQEENCRCLSFQHKQKIISEMDPSSLISFAFFLFTLQIT